MSSTQSAQTDRLAFAAHDCEHNKHPSRQLDHNYNFNFDSNLIRRDLHPHLGRQRQFSVKAANSTSQTRNTSRTPSISHLNSSQCSHPIAMSNPKQPKLTSRAFATLLVLMTISLSVALSTPDSTPDTSQRDQIRRSEASARFARQLGPRHGQQGAPDPRSAVRGHLPPAHQDLHYQTKYACEGNRLDLSCQTGSWIHLVRANYGRFSVSICNEHGHSNLSVTCFSFRAFLLMETRCNNLNNCSVQVSKELFGEPCEGTSKYLEVQYFCDDGRNNSSPQAQPSHRLPVSLPAATPTAAPPAEPQQQAQLPGLSASPSPAADEPHCPRQTSARHLQWAETRAGAWQHAACPEGASGQASWFCEPQRLRFAPSSGPDFGQCRSPWLARLAHKLDAALERPAEEAWLSGPTQVHESRLDTIALALDDLSLMAKTKSLFADDLRRLESMLGQVNGHLRALASSMAFVATTATATATGSQQPRLAAKLAQLHEASFARQLAIVSSLFEWPGQRLAWLELSSAESRAQLELRLLQHLRDSGHQLAVAWSQSQSQSQSHSDQSWRQPNVHARLVAASSHDSDEPSQALDSDAGSGPDFPDFRLGQAARQLLGATGAKLLLFDIRKPDFSAIKSQLEQQANSIDSDSNSPGQQSPSSWRIFGAFAINPETGHFMALNTTQFDAEWPLSVHFRFAPNPMQLQGQQQGRHCASLSLGEQAGQCRATFANQTHVVCGCDSVSGFKGVAPAPPLSLEPPGGSSSASAGQTAPTPETLEPRQFDEANSVQPTFIMPAPGPAKPVGVAASSYPSWSSLFVLVGLCLLVLSLGGFLAGLYTKSSAHHSQPASLWTPKKEPSSNGSGASQYMQAAALISGATNNSGYSGGTTQSTSIIGLNQAAANSCVAPNGRQLYAAGAPHLGGKASMMDLTSGVHGDHQVSWARRLLGLMATPSRWRLLSGSTSARLDPNGNSGSCMRIQHRIINPNLSMPSYHQKSQYQNGYTTNILHHQHQHLPVNQAAHTHHHHAHHQGAQHNLMGANSSSTSSYVSSSAYYEEIGPSQITKLSTSQLVSPNQPNYHFTNTSAPRMEPQQSVNPNYGHAMSTNLVGHHTLRPAALINASTGAPSNSDNQCHSSGSSQASSNSTHMTGASSQSAHHHHQQHHQQPTMSPRHLLFASPSAVSAYKNSLSQHGLHLNQQYNHNQLHQQPFQHNGVSDRF